MQLLRALYDQGTVLFYRLKVTASLGERGGVSPQGGPLLVVVESGSEQNPLLEGPKTSNCGVDGRLGGGARGG